MLRRYVVLIALLLVQIAHAQEAAAPAVEPAVLQSVEEKYSSEVAKAEALVAKAETELAKSRKLAAEVRLKAYKDRLVEITKSGDFDKALAFKARIEQLEKEPEADRPKPTKRPRPKDVVKFGGHTYALIKEPATWHVAKQRCEEMGGHLVIADSQKEIEFLTQMCSQSKIVSAWVGATDEIAEGQWRWVDGTEAKFSSPHIGDGNGGEHYMELNVKYGWNDGGGIRNCYLCEWDR